MAARPIADSSLRWSRRAVVPQRQVVFTGLRVYTPRPTAVSLLVVWVCLRGGWTLGAALRVFPLTRRAPEPPPGFLLRWGDTAFSAFGVHLGAG